MVLLAIRINPLTGEHKLDEEGNIVCLDHEQDDDEFDAAHESIVWVDTSDIWDIENGMSDVKDILYGWTAEDKKSEATKT